MIIKKHWYFNIFLSLKSQPSYLFWDLGKIWFLSVPLQETEDIYLNFSPMIKTSLITETPLIWIFVKFLEYYLFWDSLRSCYVHVWDILVSHIPDIQVCWTVLLSTSSRRDYSSNASPHSQSWVGMSTFKSSSTYPKGSPSFQFCAKFLKEKKRCGVCNTVRLVFWCSFKRLNSLFQSYSLYITSQMCPLHLLRSFVHYANIQNI